MTKEQIEWLLADENRLRATCITMVETIKQVCLKQLDVWTFQRLNQFTADQYVEFARKNLNEKLSKM